jgi:hypothetical protein
MQPKRDHADPAERAGVHVADGPVGVMRLSELTDLIDIIGPSKVDMP